LFLTIYINDGNILQCVFESKNNLKLYEQDGNQDSEDTNQFVTKQRENECININIDHTSVKKFEKRGFLTVYVVVQRI
jgi:major membrane immunogen (membrane-anchored lipoprotein)